MMSRSRLRVKHATTTRAAPSFACSALPVLGLERRRGESVLVREIGIGDLAPAEADLLRPRHAFGGDDNGFAVDDGLGGNELAVGAGDLELAERLAVPR